jgi:hypothetical protein
MCPEPQQSLYDRNNSTEGLVGLTGVREDGFVCLEFWTSRRLDVRNEEGRAMDANKKALGSDRRAAPPGQGAEKGANLHKRSLSVGWGLRNAAVELVA